MLFVNIIIKTIMRLLGCTYKKISNGNILVYRSAALGDFIMSIPAFTYLRKIYPNKKIYLLTTQSADKEQKNKVVKYTVGNNKFPWINFVYPNLIDGVYFIEDLSLKSILNDLKPMIGCLNIKECYLLTDPGAPLLGRLKKIILIRALGFWGPIYGWRDKSTIEYNRNEQFLKGYYKHHIVGQIESILENPKTRNERITVEFELNIEKNAVLYAEKLWKSLKLNDKKVIILSPGSIQPHKRWPLEKFKELIIELLSYDAFVNIVITGTKNDIMLENGLLSLNNDRVHSIIGKTNIMELAAVCAKAYVVIGNDGGTMHLADAVGARVISICPNIEFPNTIEPWHNIENAVRYNIHNLNCSPCYNFKFCKRKDNKCLNNISTQMVMQYYKKMCNKNFHPNYNHIIVKVNNDGTIINH